MPRQVLLLLPEFPYTFWSYTESCRLQGAKSMSPPLGLLTAAAMLPEDWSLRFRDLNTAPLREEDWQWADMVMISAMLAQRDNAVALIGQCRERGIPCVAGGPYPTSAPEDFLAAGCDYLVLGEGENSIPRFLAALEQGAASGVFTCDEKPDISGRTYIPRYDLIDFRDYAHVPLQISRGCPFDCEFCDIVHLYGRKQRYKSPDQVIRELENLYQLGYRGHVFIVDDNFIGSRAKTREILHSITAWNARRGEPFGYGTQASINLGQDREMIDLLTAANFGQIFIGIESPDENVLRANAKMHNITNPLAESLHTIRANGLTVVASFVIGFDGEHSGVAERIIAFVEENALPLAMLNLLYVLPQTRLAARISAEGRLKSQFHGQYMLGGLNFIPQRPEQDIQEDFITLWDRLYEPSRFLARAYRETLIMRPTRAYTARSRGTHSPAAQTPATDGKKPMFSVQKLKKLRAMLRLIWLQGIKSPCRAQFWGQLIGILHRNPSRVVAYLITCGTGESLFAYREFVLSWRRDRRRSQS